MNEPIFIPEFPDPISQKAGIIYLANESRFSSGTFSQPLTEFAAGWSDPEGVRAILDYVAPQVQAGRQFEFAMAKNDASVPAEDDAVRAIGADFKQVDTPTPHELGSTLNKGLTIRMDWQGGAGVECVEQMYIIFLLARLYRNDFKRAIALLDANASNAAKTWDPDTEVDPDADVMDALIAAETASGLAPNRVLYGQTAYRLRAKTLRGQDHAGVASTAGASTVDLAPIFGVDEVRVSGHRYQGQQAAKDRIVGSVVYAFFGRDQMTLDDASNLKRFVTPMPDGSVFRVHRVQVNSSLVDLTVEHYSNVLCTGTAGIQKLTVS